LGSRAKKALDTASGLCHMFPTMNQTFATFSLFYFYFFTFGYKGESVVSV
jgi:hypothetical protein